MGNGQSNSGDAPGQFVVQSRGDWDRQMSKLLKSKPTVIKTVILPPGVQLDDPRLQYGEVVEESTYELPSGDLGAWPSDRPFEADLDKNLLPPAWGRKGVAAHYAVYPDSRFQGSRCGICELTQQAAAQNKNYET